MFWNVRFRLVYQLYVFIYSAYQSLIIIHSGVRFCRKKRCLWNVLHNKCWKDNSDIRIDPKSSNESSLNGFILERSSIDNLLTSSDESKNIHKQRPHSKFISCSTIHALVMKNLLKLMRNPSVLIMMIFLPIIMVVSFCLAFGNEAYNIPFVIVNDELPYMLDNCPPYIQGCKHLESPS